MNIKNLIKEDQDIWIATPIDEGFEVKIRFASKEAITRMTKNATVKKLDRKHKTQYEVLDDDVFMNEFIEHCLIDWKGLTVEVLSRMVLIDSQALGDDSQEEIEFSVENALDLIQHDTTKFADWLMEAVRDVENFYRKKDTSS